MKFPRLLVLLAVPFFLAGCGLTEQEKADDATVQRSGVSPATYDKMVHGDALSLSDIGNLSRARVNDGVILRYLRDQGTIYTLNTDEVIALRKAGVDQSVIDYMLQTARYRAPDPYFYPYPYGYDPFWYGPYGPGFYGAFGYYHHWHGGGGYGGYHHH